MTADPIPFPASPYCRVRARVASIWADGPDDGTHPDWRPATGEKVTLTPSIGSQLLTYDVAGPEPIIVTVERVECVVDEDGWLTKNDGRPVFIAPTDDPLLSATGWTWTANIKGKSVVFAAPTGGVVDLAMFIAAPATDNTKLWVERIPELVDAAAEQATAAVAAAQSAQSAEAGAIAARDAASVITGLTGEDEAVALIVSNPDSVLRSALDTTHAPRSQSRFDGVNIRDLKRPTLNVSRMFPNEGHDHQIVHVDEEERVAYAIGVDRKLRKSQWTASVQTTNAATSFGVALAAPPAGKVWAANGLFVRIKPTVDLPNGVLLVEERDEGSGSERPNTCIKRCVNDVNSPATTSLTFETVWTAPPNVSLLGPQSIARDEVTGYLYLVPYITNASVTTVTIYRSTDNGATWPAWFTYPRANSGAGTIRHWHSARWDQFSQRVWFMAGDGQEDAGLWRVNASGSAPEKVVTNSQVRSQIGQPAGARAVDVMFFPNYIAWGVDGSGGINYITSMNRDQIGTPEPQVQQIATMNSAGWWTQRASADWKSWIVCGTNDTSVLPEHRIDKDVHLYAVTETATGLQVDEVASAAMESMGSSSSISGMGGGNGGGEYFWMRAHNYGPHPRLTYSGFQFRASLGWGVTDLKIPTPSRRHYGGGQVSGVYELTPGETKIIGHTVAPEHVSGLDIFDIGALILSPEGLVRVEVWDTVADRYIARWDHSQGQDWRADTNQGSSLGMAATTAYASALKYVAAGTLIHFRLVEYGIKNCVASAYVRYGWGAS